MDTFSRMLNDKEASYVRNNLAFCQLLTGNVVVGLENASKAVAGDYEPLFELNKGLGEFLGGSVEAAKKSLRNALEQLHAPESKFDPSTAYCLVLAPTLNKVSSHEKLPVDAAILLNLWRMGATTRAELETALAKLYADKAQPWLASFPEP